MSFQKRLFILDSKVFNWKMFEKMVGLPLNNLSLLNQKEEIETLLELFLSEQVSGDLILL